MNMYNDVTQWNWDTVEICSEWVRLLGGSEGSIKGVRSHLIAFISALPSATWLTELLVGPGQAFCLLLTSGTQEGASVLAALFLSLERIPFLPACSPSSAGAGGLLPSGQCRGWQDESASTDEPLAKLISSATVPSNRGSQASCVLNPESRQKFQVLLGILCHVNLGLQVNNWNVLYDIM